MSTCLVTNPILTFWLGVFDDSQNLVGESNPQTSLSASIADLELDPGDYFIKIDGVARDNSYDPLTDQFNEPSPPPYTVSGPEGYSDYGSLGQYRISGVIVDTALPTVSIATTTNTLSEGETAELVLTSSDGGSVDVTVQIQRPRQSAPGSPAPNATEPEDFGVSTTQVVSIVDGSATLQIPIIDDTLVESSEWFDVAITQVEGYAVADRVASIEVLETRTSYSIFATDAVTAEGDPSDPATQQFAIRRLGRDDIVNSVGWRRVTSGADPADEVDFSTPIEGLLQFDAGETSKMLDVGIAGDLDVEADETYQIELFVPDGESFEIDSSRSTADGRIDDDESVVSIASEAQFRLRQTNYDNGSFDNWAFDDFEILGTSISDDFDPDIDNENWESIQGAFPSGVFPGSDGNALVFGAFDDERAATTVAVSPPEGSRIEFSIIFAAEDGGGLNATEPGEDAVLEYSLNGTDWIEIQRLDEAEFPAWFEQSIPIPTEATFAPASIDEGDSGDTILPISIPRTGYLDKQITIDWQVVPSGANPVSADDFVGGLPNGTVTILAGEVSGLVELQIATDTNIEPDETFQLQLSNNSGGPILNGNVLGMIVNDDFAFPEINLLGANGLSISDPDFSPSVDDGTDFGAIAIGDIDTHLFEIQNLGVLDLNIGTISIEGEHADDFSVTALPDSVIEPSQSSTFELTFEPLGSGLREALIMIANDDPNESNYTFAVSAIASDLDVESVSVNDGQPSRSQIDSVKVVFNQFVVHQSVYQAFVIKNLDTDRRIRWLTATPEDVDGRTEVTLTFQGPGGLPATWSDGHHELMIRADTVTAAGPVSYPMINEYYFGSNGVDPVATDNFFRLFGDADGDGDVDITDLQYFGSLYSTDLSSPNFDPLLDFDDDDDIDGRDLAEVRRRLHRYLH